MKLFVLNGKGEIGDGLSWCGVFDVLGESKLSDKIHCYLSLLLFYLSLLQSIGLFCCICIVFYNSLALFVKFQF